MGTVHRTYGVILMGRINITTACAEHASVLAGLGAQTFCQSYGAALEEEALKAYVDEVFPLERIQRELVDPEIHYLIAWVGGVICAYAKLVASPLPECLKAEDAVELQRLYVVPEHWGQGVGSRLMTSLIDLAATRAYGHMWLRVWQENQRAIEFYRKWAFSSVGSDTYHVGACSETVLIMVKGLSHRVRPALVRTRP